MTPRAEKARRCPVCGKPPDEAHAPFCSRRCADIDLHRWLAGGYRIETDEKPDESSPSQDNEE